MVNSISRRRRISPQICVLLLLPILCSGPVWAVRPKKTDQPTSSSAVAADAATTRPRVIFALPYQELRTIARQCHTSEKHLMQMNPGLTPENLTPGDAILAEQSSQEIPLLPERGREVARGIRGRKQIALTFDCGWVEKKDLDKLLALLKEKHVDASFFLTGIFLKGNPKGVRLITKAGFPVYNHTETHPHMTKIDDDKVKEELLSVERTVHTSSTITTHPYWRPPFGDRNARVLAATSAIGFQSVYWTLDSRDSASSPTLKPKQIVKRVLSRKSSKDADPLDGAILLFHTAAPATPPALEEIIPALRKRGYTFVDLPTLLDPSPTRAKKGD